MCGIHTVHAYTQTRTQLGITTTFSFMMFGITDPDGNLIHDNGFQVRGKVVRLLAWPWKLC